MFFFVFGMHYFFFLSSDEEERAGYFAFIVVWMSCYSKCPVTLPHGAVGLSAVCACGISRSYSLIFIVLKVGQIV